MHKFPKENYKQLSKKNGIHLCLSGKTHTLLKSQSKQSFRTVKIWILIKFLFNSTAKNQCFKQSSSCDLPEKVNFTAFKQLWSGKQHQPTSITIKHLSKITFFLSQIFLLAISYKVQCALFFWHFPMKPLALHDNVLLILRT